VAALGGVLAFPVLVCLDVAETTPICARYALLPAQQGVVTHGVTHGVGRLVSLAETERVDTVAFMVSDWVWYENLRPFLEVVSWLTGYSFDDLDWDAITVGLVEAERTQIDSWFDYPLGDIALRLRDYGVQHHVHFELEGMPTSSVESTWRLW
jgi:hypothetical protein